MNFSLNQLYSSVGISKQAVHQYAHRQTVFDQQVSQLVMEVDELRAEHPGCGVEKMYHSLKPGFMGRDRFVELFMDLGYGLKKARNYRRTTLSGKIHYPNLIGGMRVNGPSQVWQSDITYIQVGSRFYYAVFIVDVYTKQIVGYQVSDHMRAQANLQALRMALKHHKPPKIHHSDRGSQYTYKHYTSLLKSLGCIISMGLCAQENAYAERVNGTIKQEYLEYWNPGSLLELKRMVRKAVKNYNEKRVHQALNYKTPNLFASSNQKEQLIIFDYQNN